MEASDISSRLKMDSSAKVKQRVTKREMAAINGKRTKDQGMDLGHGAANASGQTEMLLALTTKMEKLEPSSTGFLDWGQAVEAELEKEKEEKEYFPYNPEMTDLTLIVEEKKLYVAKIVLMEASPVFRKMLTDEFKEKNASEIPLPGKEYSSFVLFLRCIFPREYVTLTESNIEELLPLAHEYDVKCILRECETWLLTELEFKKAKVPFHHLNVESDVKYLVKCLYYGSEYNLKELYGECFQTLIPYKLTRYMQNEYYSMLPEKNKRKLLESRLSMIEQNGNKSRRIVERVQNRRQGFIESVEEEVIQYSNSLFK
ncbi:uncharacterized protein LOC133195286 [Saccostrea echinata]|uniref:uncharacterized protein LOC133195286 n=1 Tax=Saccostrea echinata TaxID=191078 RepID=UPI002A7F4FEC|nr:uncharacterized protein LOC133195286 [Saccostrea echinata]